MSVRLHIERLVVEGLDLTAQGRRQLIDALREELGGRFSNDFTASWTEVAVPSLRLGDISVAASGGDELGRKAGATLHQGLRR